MVIRIPSGSAAEFFELVDDALSDAGNSEKFIGSIKDDATRFRLVASHKALINTLLASLSIFYILIQNIESSGERNFLKAKYDKYKKKALSMSGKEV